MKGLFVRAIENKEKIVVFYMDSSGSVTQRLVRILKMNDTHLLVYCYYRKKVRTLKLDQILSAAPRKGIA